MNKKTLYTVIVFILLFHFGYAQEVPKMQNQNTVHNKNGISFKALFLDYQSFNGGSFSSLKDNNIGFEIAYQRYLTNNFGINIPFKMAVVQSHSDIVNTRKAIYGLDIQFNYEFAKSHKVFPYLLAGVGAVYERKGDFNTQIPVGAGLKWRIADNAFLNWQFEYRKSLGEDRDNLQNGLGFIYYFGKKKVSSVMEEKTEENMDSDGDGILDEFDLCPNSPGTKELIGCPDTDGDGLADFEDACPEEKGTKALQGCPDTDGDGLADRLDECPHMYGSVAHNGCPNTDNDKDGIPNDLDRCPDIAGPASNNGCPQLDTDGDGVMDSQDKCPSNAGPKATAGCPDRDGDGLPDFEDKCPSSPGLKAFGGCPDSDGDGIDDSRDRCPERAGTIAANGCPEIAEEDKAVLDLAMRAVQFDTGRASLKLESFNILAQISDLMAKYPDFNLRINGHTDNQGEARSNQILSENRARECYDYLLSRNINPSRLSYKGYGESTPIADNSTLRGRALNRRVEFQMSIR